MKSITKQIPYEKMRILFQQCFGNPEVLARETKFVQRHSSFSGMIFLHTLLLGFLKNPHASLTELAVSSLELGVAISPQGIHSRINGYAAAFLKRVYEQALDRLKNSVQVPIALLQQFSAIWVIDSTFKQLPAEMAQEYPGSGGKASPASLKTQLVFEFLRGNLSQVDLQPGRCADQAYRAYLTWVQAGSLVLMDLGYFCLTSLRTIAQAGAYFIIRYLTPTTLSTLAGERLDLLALLQAHDGQTLDQEVLIGADPQQPLSGRLIACPVPASVAEERRRKARRSAVTHGKTRSERHLALLGWSIFLTNVPSNWLSTAQVMAVYRIRWQIELIFKFWKSDCGFEAIPATRSSRVMTELYAKLLIALWVLFLAAPVRVPDENFAQREVSMVQVRKLLASTAQPLLTQLAQPAQWILLLKSFYELVARFGFKQRRTARPNVMALFAGMTIPALLA